MATNTDQQLRDAARRLREYAESRPVPAWQAPRRRSIRSRLRRLSSRMLGPRLLAVAAAAMILVIAVGLGYRLRPANPATSSAALADRPTAAAYGLGSLWITDERGGLLQVDPVALTVARRIPVAANPTAVAVAGDSVWVLCANDRHLYRYRPADGKTQTVPSSIGAVGLAVTSGRLFVLSAGNRTLDELDPADGHTMHALVLPPGPSTLAAGPDEVLVAAGRALLTADVDTTGYHTLATMADDITALAAEPSGTTLVGLATGELDAVDPGGHVAVVTELPSTPTAIVVDGDTAWAATEDGSLMWLSTADGRLTPAGQTGLPGIIVAATSVGGGSIAVVTQDPSQIIIQRKRP